MNIMNPTSEALRGKSFLKSSIEKNDLCFMMSNFSRSPWQRARRVPDLWYLLMWYDASNVKSVPLLKYLHIKITT